MPRAALITLLAAFVLSVSLQAQRAAASFHGSAARSPARSGSVARHSFANRVSSRSGLRPAGRQRPDAFGSYFLPYGDLFTDEQPEAEASSANSPLPLVVTPPAPEPALRQAQFIEIPGVASSAVAKMPPPAVFIFILATGERLETRRFVLSASVLSVSIDRQQRTIPLDMLDLQATINANHERGIDLRIPIDRNEISLSF
jgi:hypothetical protein